MARVIESGKSTQVVENNGDVVHVRKGIIDDFHIISPDGEVEVMRQVGALSEMLFERVKNAFGASLALVVVETHPCRVVLFPKEGGVAVWKTMVGTQEILEVVHTSNRTLRRDKQARRRTHP